MYNETPKANVVGSDERTSPTTFTGERYAALSGSIVAYFNFPYFSLSPGAMSSITFSLPCCMARPKRCKNVAAPSACNLANFSGSFLYRVASSASLVVKGLSASTNLAADPTKLSAPALVDAAIYPSFSGSRAVFAAVVARAFSPCAIRLRLPNAAPVSSGTIGGWLSGPGAGAVGWGAAP